MQNNIAQTLRPLCGRNCIRASTGQITQVRNHVKMYPWRHARNNSECYLATDRTPYTDRYNINEFKSSKKQLKEWQKVVPKDADERYNRYKWHEAYTSDPVEAKETSRSRLQRFQQSLLDRGQARESREYTPPNDVQERVLKIFYTIQLNTPDVEMRSSTTDEDTLAFDLDQARALKFNLITACIDEFDHDLPGPYLNEVVQVSDLVDYFSTPVRGINPFSSLLKQSDSLPTNLSLISEAHRFDKETDVFFKGYTALPGIVSKVPGLRAQKKYPTLNQDEFQWPDI